MKRNLLLICLAVLLIGSIIVVLATRSTKISDNKEYFGITGFGPVNYPEFKDKDGTNYWNDISKYANIYGVHSSLIDADAATLYSTNLKMPLYLLINQSDIHDLTKLYTILDSTPQIIYVGIGNEINLLYKDNPEEYNSFFETAKQVFPKLKKKYPNIEFFTVFQYESFIGKGYLFGETFEDSTHLIKDWDSVVDFFGFSLYPHFDYGTPDEIPLNYFDKITSLTNKRFAITETTWPSELNQFKGSDSKFNTSQVEQATYIDWIKKINTKYNPKFINWLFLNDIEFGNPAFNGAALRDNQGSPKLAAGLWLGLIN